MSQLIVGCGFSHKLSKTAWYICWDEMGDGDQSGWGFSIICNPDILKDLMNFSYIHPTSDANILRKISGGLVSISLLFLNRIKKVVG